MVSNKQKAFGAIMIALILFFFSYTVFQLMMTHRVTLFFVGLVSLLPAAWLVRKMNHHSASGKRTIGL